MQVGQFRGKVEVFDAAIRMEQELGASLLFQQIDRIIKEGYLKFHDETLDFDLAKVTSRTERIKLRNILLQMGINNQQIINFLHEFSYSQMLRSQFSAVKNCHVRLYLIECFDLASRDIGSFSDPYYVVSCGKKTQDNKQNFQLDEPNPQFHVCLNFSGQFPGADPLVIQLWDFDDLFGDDLIGTTVIELNDRWYCPDWKAIDYKPVEHRELYHPSSSLS